MPSFAADANGVYLLDTTPTGLAGAAIQANAVRLSGHLGATADAHPIAAITGLADALAAKGAAAGSTSIVTVGTVAAGTWHGTTIGVPYGGTGLTSVAAGKLLYASGANTFAELSLGGGLAISGGVLSASGVGLGTVTSVDVAVPTGELSVSGGPVTDSGTITIAWATQAAKKCLMGPTSGSAAAPGFRTIATTDLPTGIDAANIGGGTVSNTEFGYLDGVTSSVQGQINAKFTLPSQSGQSGKFLTTDGTSASWGTPSGGGGSPTPTPGLTDVLAANNDAGGLSIINFGDLSGGDFVLNFLSVGNVEVTNYMSAGAFRAGTVGSYNAGVTGTFTAPTSITVQGGIITAIS